MKFTNVTLHPSQRILLFNRWCSIRRNNKYRDWETSDGFPNCHTVVKFFTNQKSKHLNNYHGIL